MSKHEFPPSIARELFDYQDGLLYWNLRARSYFRDDRSHAVWNARFAGKPAGHIHKSRSGERHKTTVTIDGVSVRLLASRVVWAWHHGSWPSGIVDHEDGDTLNDRIGNLRDVTSSQNSQNMRMHPDNTSGVTGVHWHKQRGKWVASIMANRNSRYLGIYDNLDEAIAVRKAAEATLGFHPNHGRSAHV